MDFYDGIEFISFNTSKACRTFVDYTFDYYSINFVSKGYLYFIDSSGKKIKICALSAWWTLPGIRYRYGCMDNVPWEQNWIAFKGPRADKYLEKSLLPNKKLPVALIKNKSFAEDFRKTLNLLTFLPHNYGECINMLERLLLYLQQTQNKKGRYSQKLVPYAEKFSVLEEKILKNPHCHFDFKLEAKKTGLSYSRFRQLFKELNQLSPQSYLIEQRMNKAAQMLLGCDRRISEIAAACGFEDQYYFSRIFSRRYGQSPSEYRKENLYSSALK